MKATFCNVDEQMAATVTPVEHGYAVTLIDCETENIVATRIYPKGKGPQAVACAREWIFGKDELVQVEL